MVWFSYSGKGNGRKGGGTLLTPGDKIYEQKSSINTNSIAPGDVHVHNQ